jgi:GNAT superfamily N-acetyltransferase
VWLLLYSRKENKNHPVSISIRPLLDTDLETAEALLNLAFQSSVNRLHELRLYRQMQPDGWLAATRGEQLIGMVGAVNYGAIAHIGLMAVHPEAQRQGVGLALMQNLIAELEKQYVPLITLDASEAGRPLYDKLGFVAYDKTLVFQRHSNPAKLGKASRISSISVQELDELAHWDTGAFGADRRKVFKVLLDNSPRRAFIIRGEDGQPSGYLFAQRNRIGPWVMLQPNHTEELLQAALALPFDETISMNVPSVNREAIELARRYGFEMVRANQHMGRGAVGVPGQRQKIYSQTSLAVG